MELYAFPDILNVDCSKQNESVRFADRTAAHIKNGLQEVILPPTEKPDQTEGGKER